MSNDKSKAARLAEWCDYAATTQDMGRDPDPNALYRQAAAELRRLDAVTRELLEALAFYADEDRYYGPNQRIKHPDKWSDQAGENVYRLDVTKDRGSIAKAAIAKATDV